MKALWRLLSRRPPEPTIDEVWKAALREVNRRQMEGLARRGGRR